MGKALGYVERPSSETDVVFVGLGIVLGDPWTATRLPVAEQKAGSEDVKGGIAEGGERFFGLAFDAQIEEAERALAPIAETSIEAPSAGRTRRPGEGDHITEIDAPEGISAARGLDGGAERAEGVIDRLAQTRYGRLDSHRNR